MKHRLHSPALSTTDATWLADTFARNRARFGGWRMEAEGEGDGNPPADGSGDPEQAFTQADVDRIVKERVQRERAKYADYDDLKVKAGEKATLEERVAEIEARAVKAETEALRARVAAEFGISTKAGPNGEPSDADLFLTGTDAESLTAQAKRLADRESERKKNGNHAPREGNNPQSGDDPVRNFARGLFDRANSE